MSAKKNDASFTEKLFIVTSRIRLAYDEKFSKLSDNLTKLRNRPTSEEGLFNYLPSNQGVSATKHVARQLLMILIVIIFVIALIMASLACGGWYFLNIDRPTALNLKNNIILKIPKNSSAQDIAFQLQDLGLIKNSAIFRIGVKVFKADKNLHAGMFSLKSDLTIKEIIEIITGRNGAASQITFTIPEGYSLTDIAGLLEQRQIVSSNEFLEYARYGALGNLSDSFAFLAYSPIPSLEGYLYPDTYVVVPGLSAHQLAKMMVERFNDKIYNYYLQNKELSPTLNNHHLTFHELLSLAAIVEKEAVVDKERNVIAEVFLNRLKTGMTFGADPTVKYAIGEEHKPIVSFEDIKSVSPYNTYRFKGLPPGPIASPGLKSFQAVFHPTATKYLYFIAKGDGTHYFSYNAKQHDNLRNKLGYDSGK